MAAIQAPFLLNNDLFITSESFEGAIKCHKTPILKLSLKPE